MGFGIKVDVSGPRACFTRPEMKAERVSYDVITPSAARGILESVYWKPAIKWVIDGIHVINQIKTATFRRNEVGSKASYNNARSVALGGKDVRLGIAASEDRQQRQTLYLEDVRYVIEAHFEMTRLAGESDNPEKHYNIALRRLRKGQCFNQPYLGCREFAVSDIHLCEEGEETPQSFYDGQSVDLGYMLYDIDFSNGMSPQFFRAVMVDGYIDVAEAWKEVVS
ncbi:type I-C CRISPR-associated protein Cas5c [uncultured Parolsenella sp.]|uniref:type I-C CRISPR-associated protein Cas5c n=1 Tax=uncultured Parolsenella sp. TaxID=2083008 RepID=UPI0025F990EA|nr:type I-C CRISPR-associated protein Cas5c [uncultured Parolsenella sp.]